MSTSIRRERNYTQFPRNTKERHLRTCAAQAREQERVKAEQEACYEEWQPVQIHSCKEMVEADGVGWLLGCVESGDLPRDVGGHKPECVVLCSELLS